MGARHRIAVMNFGRVSEQNNHNPCMQERLGMWEEGKKLCECDMYITSKGHTAAIRNEGKGYKGYERLSPTQDLHNRSGKTYHVHNDENACCRKATKKYT